MLAIRFRNAPVALSVATAPQFIHTRMAYDIERRKYMNRLVHTSVLASAAFLVAIDANADKCADAEYQKHQTGAHNFATSSAVETSGSRTRYWSCVSNLDHSGDLRIHWYVPGPGPGWIPAGTHLDTPRFGHPEARPISGCLKYGNLANIIHNAEFLGSKREAKRSTREQESNCRHPIPFRDRQASTYYFERPSNGWMDQFRLFFPTNLEDTYNTMVRLEAKVSVSINEEVTSINMVYQASLLEGRNSGDPTMVRYVVRFPSAESMLADIAYRQISSEPQSLGEDGGFAFDITNAQMYRMAPMAIKFLDTRNELLGVFEASVLTPLL